MGELAATLARLLAAAGPLPVRWADDEGEHWLVVPDRERLRAARPAAAIGFFGQARATVDHGPLLALEESIVGRADALGGLLAYYNVGLSRGGWGNLVLIAPGATVLAAMPDHAVAVGRAAAHYHSIRLHTADLPEGVAAPAALALQTTTLFDFDTAPTRRTVRVHPAT